MINSDRSYLSSPFIGVGVVIWRDNEFLLIKRGKQPRIGEWSIPGGKQELGETILDAVSREVMEETSITIQIEGLVDVVDSITKDDFDQVRFHATLIDFVATYVSGTPTPGDDALDLRWFKLEDLYSLELWDETSRIIRDSAKILKQK